MCPRSSAIDDSAKNMSTQAAPPRRILPKRPRKETTYFPDESQSENEAEEAPQPSKRVKHNAAPKKPRVDPKKKIFPFMSLPPEIKNMIYHYALVSVYEIPVGSTKKTYSPNLHICPPTQECFRRFRRTGYGYRKYEDYGCDAPMRLLRPSITPTLLALNHEIHAQTQAMLYGANTFAFADAKTLLAFFAVIGPKNCGTIQEVSIKYWGDTGTLQPLNFATFAVLASAVNLKSLNLDHPVDILVGPQAAKQFFRAAYPWLVAPGVDRGRPYAAVDIVRLGMQHVRWWNAHSLSIRSPEEISSDRRELEDKTKAFRRKLRKLLGNQDLA
ncbi:hypothetical protein XANCAGTX0491_001399 [Xanthoria calcicola]